MHMLFNANIIRHTLRFLERELKEGTFQGEGTVLMKAWRNGIALSAQCLRR